MRWLAVCAPLLASWACATDDSSGIGRSGAGGNGATGGGTPGTGGSGPGTGGTGFGGSTGGGSSFGGSAGSTSVGGSGAAPSGCTGTAPVGGTNPLIDDLEDGDNATPLVDGRTGFWFVANDGTMGGTQTPDPSAFAPENGGANGSMKAAHTTGTGFTVWGGVMGVSFNAVGNLTCPYNASAFTGIEFWAKGTGSVRVMVGTAGSIPVSAGGTCTPEDQCHNHHGKAVTFTSDWVKYTLAWGDLTQDSTWGAQIGDIDPSKVIQINFQAAAPFDFWIDEVAFTGGGAPPDGGGTGGSGGTGTDAGGD